MNLPEQGTIVTLLDILTRRGQCQPEKCAYIFLSDGETESECLTFGELYRKSIALAASLKSMSGERVLLLYPSSLEFIISFFGCLYARVIAVPVYPPRQNKKLLRLLSIIKDTQAKVALTTTEIRNELEKKQFKQAELASIQLIATDIIKTSESEFVASPITSEDLAFLQYTSGSTGDPKGVMVTHKNIIHNLQLICKTSGHNENSISVGWLPLFHDMGLFGLVLQPLYLGFTSILMPPSTFIRKPGCWLKAICKYRATTPLLCRTHWLYQIEFR